MLAAFRLLAQMVRRDMRTSASLAMNNLFFLVVFLLQGSNRRTMAGTALPFAVLLGLPLLLAFSGDPLRKIPAARLALWPLTNKERVGLRLLGLALTPAVWLTAVLLLLLRVGLPLALTFFAAMVCVQGMVAAIGWGDKPRYGISGAAISSAAARTAGGCLTAESAADDDDAGLLHCVDGERVRDHLPLDRPPR